MYVCSKYVPIHHAVLNNIFEKRQCFFFVIQCQCFSNKNTDTFQICYWNNMMNWNIFGTYAVS